MCASSGCRAASAGECVLESSEPWRRARRLEDWSAGLPRSSGCRRRYSRLHRRWRIQGKAPPPAVTGRRRRCIGGMEQQRIEPSRTPPAGRRASGAPSLDGFRERSLSRGRQPVSVLGAARDPRAGVPHLLPHAADRPRAPAEVSGPLLLASNHRSFLDPFVIGMLVRRPVYYMAKRELFEKRWQAWILNALGAFPVDRGTGDAAAMDTARAILERGDCVVVFPEGTRMRRGPLASPDAASAAWRWKPARPWRRSRCSAPNTCAAAGASARARSACARAPAAASRRPATPRRRSPRA